MGVEFPPVIACTLTGNDLGRQSERWQRLLADAGIERVEAADGLRLRFRALPSVAAELHELVAVENGCCAWARWEVVEEGDVLTMAARSAGDGVRALHSMLRHRVSAGPSCGCDEC